MKIHRKIKGLIEERLAAFRRTWSEGEEAVFCELAFCLLTPQSKAKVCWDAVERLRSTGVLFAGGEREIAGLLRPVRFWRKKAKFIVEARRRFTRGGRLALREELSPLLERPEEAREFLVREVRGMGYKEASHFLRNIGWGGSLAILDRHILRSLAELGVIESIPGSLGRRRYMEIEQKMREFSREIGIPMPHLDFVLWYSKTGEVFK